MPAKKTTTGLQPYLKNAKKMKFPAGFSPMLATLSEMPKDEEGWVFEVKWDGFRAVALMNNGNIDLRSRNDKSFNDKFYPVVDALRDWNINAIIDGEVIVADHVGASDFGTLQNWRSEADGELLYYLFDLMWLDGYDLTGLPLSERRNILRAVLPQNDLIRLSEQFEATGSEAFRVVNDLGLEGLIAKRAHSTYQPGLRTKDWLKVKTSRRQEVVIGRYTRNEGTSKAFRSLLVGVYDNGQFHYTGKVGTGFNKKMQEDMIKLFKSRVIKKSPFISEPDVNKPSRFRPDPPKAEAIWLRPDLVCEINFRELTSDGVMRHPSFLGMRDDKDPKDVVLEQPAPAAAVDEVLTEKKMIMPAGKKQRKTLLNPSEETQVKTVDGKELKFTNLSKVFWPDEQVSKRDMINYYYQVAPFILPYLKDRPLTLNRHPNGINGKSFYQKDVKGKAPAWIDTFPYYSNADERAKEFLVCTNEASLLYVASLGCIEMNPWSSRKQSPDNPDWCIIDLDPDKNPFDEVIKAAQVTKEVLDAIGVSSCCKTSGSTGLHIYIPLGAKYTYEDSKEFGRKIVKLVHQQLPKFTSIERPTASRKGKLYLDFLQNRPQATVASPYSLRPKPGATVSMPLHWEEVKKGLKMMDFTIFNAVERVRTEGDIFKPVLGKGINLEQALKKLAAL